MALRLKFEKDWDIEKRSNEIAKLIFQTLGENSITKMFLEKEYDQEGNVFKVEKRTWAGPKEMELMLKSATSFLITFEKIE